MKNVIIMMWLVFAAFVLFPIATDYISGASESEVVSIIEKESEADDIAVTATEEHGNTAMYVFTVGESAFGVVTADGAQEMEFDRFGGVYKTYAIIAVILAVVSIAGGVYGVRAKRKYEEQRKKGLAA